MRLTLLFAVLAAIPFALAQQREQDGIDVLIKRLGSANSRQRDAAMEALKKDPKSVSSLREAARSPNAEIAKRAAIVLEYHDRRPVRELELAVKEGRVGSVVELLAEWPTGKYEPEAWKAVCDWTRTIAELHHKQGGEKLDMPWLGKRVPVVVICEPKVKDIRNNEPAEDGLAYFFVRTREVALSPPVKPWGETGYRPGGVFVASRSAKLQPPPTAELTILAGGPVEIGGAKPAWEMIISCGEVTISSFSIDNSIVIARGKVTCKGVRMSNCRIISGKSVLYDKKLAGRCIITENESNPLGFIRWADAPKEKAMPKSK